MNITAGRLAGIMNRRYDQLISVIIAKISERAAARISGDFVRADEIRAELDQMGFDIRDTPDGVEWEPQLGFSTKFDAWIAQNL